jgi:hypothetical protein
VGQAQATAPVPAKQATLRRAVLSVSLWPAKHTMQVTARIHVQPVRRLTALKVFLPQIIQLASAARLQGGKWVSVRWKRELETAQLFFPKGVSKPVSLRLRYSITFHSNKNYLFRAIFCRLDPEESYFLYGWYPSLQPFADPLSGRLLKNDRFPYQLRLEVPKGYRAIAAGPLLETKRLSSGRVRYVFRQSVLKEAAIFFSVATFRVIHHRPASGVQVDLFVRKGDATTQIKKLGQLVVRAEAFYRKWWGSPTGTNKRVRWQMASFGGSGARGYPFTLLLDRAQGYFQGGLSGWLDLMFSRRHVLLHEMAHTWWGNAVTGIGKGSVWLNEGMANYGSMRALGALFGKAAEQEAIRRHIRFFLVSKGRGGLFDPGGMAQMAQRTAYTKGALVFYELERILGRDKLDRGLRAYFQAYRGKFARAHDLKRILERTTGVSLDAFFQGWISGHGLPDVKLLSHACQKGTEVGCHLQVTLHNRGTLATKAIVRLTLANRQTRDVLVSVPAKGKVVHRVVLSRPPASVKLDPDGVMLHGFRLRAMFARANQLRRAGQHKVAKGLFLRILKVYPTHGYAHYSLGLLLGKQKQPAKALKAFRLAAASKPSDMTPSWLPLWASFRVASTLRQLGKQAEARRIFARLLKQPRDPYGLKQRIRSILP